MMDGSDGLREFFDAARETFQAGRARLIDQTIEVHGPRARARVSALREKHPEMADDGIADLLIRDASSRAGSVGAMVAVPGIIPGPGTVITVALSAPEGPWLFREQVKLVLEIAEVFGFDPEDRAARTPEVEDLFGRALATVQLGNTGTQLLITTVLRLGWRRRAAIIGRLLSRAGRLGPLALRGGLIRRLPLFGIPVAALANAICMTTVGTEARNRYHPATNLPAPIAQTGGGEEPPTDETGTVEEEPADVDEPSVTEEEPRSGEGPGSEEAGV
jgi:hypothetical protein